MKLKIKGEIRIPFTATVDGEAVAPSDIKRIQRDFRAHSGSLDEDVDWLLRRATDADRVTLRVARLEIEEPTP